MNKFAAILLLGLMVASVNAQAKTLKIATLLPDGTSYMKLMREGGKKVAERTEGRVKFKFYPGGVMGNDASVLRKMRVGQLHGGAFTTGTLSQFYADAAIYALPFTFTNKEEIQYVRERMDADIVQGLESAGIVPVGLTGSGFAYAMSLEKMATLEDMKGKRIWVPTGDALSEKAVKAIGASPVALPIADVYTSLQTGLLDAVGSTPVGALALQWQSKVKYVLDYPLGYIMGMLAIDAKAMNKLALSDQQIVREEMGAVFQQLDAQSWVDGQNAYAAMQQLGITKIEVSEAESARWRAIGEQTVQAVAGKNIYTTDGLAKLKKLLAEYRAANK